MQATNRGGRKLAREPSLGTFAGTYVSEFADMHMDGTSKLRDTIAAWLRRARQHTSVGLLRLDDERWYARSAT